MLFRIESAYVVDRGRIGRVDFIRIFAKVKEGLSN